MPVCVPGLAVWAAALVACGIDDRAVAVGDGTSNVGGSGNGAITATSSGGAGGAPTRPTAPLAQGGGGSIPAQAGGAPPGAAGVENRPDAGNADPDSEPGPEPAQQPEPTPSSGDVTPPSVVSVTPVEGSTQVTSELVSVQFSEPMDRGSVQAGFPGAEGFAWSADSTVVTFRLPLPFGEDARLFDIVVPAEVADVAGNALGADVETSVVLAALARVTLPFDGALSGNQIAGQDGNFTFFELGDTADGLLRYGAASFPLDGLPAFGAVRALRLATLHVQVSDIAGNPGDPAFNGFAIDRVSFSARADIDAPTVLEPAFARLLVPATVTPGRVVRLDVAAQLQAAWSAAETHLQFRFGAALSNQDAVTDTVFLRRGADENDSVVDVATLPEPDPENVARVEVEYFLL